MRPIDMPARFPGSREERLANFHSHDWWQCDENEYRCGRCDCRPGHRAADWPCGADIPREQVPDGLIGLIRQIGAA